MYSVPPSLEGHTGPGGIIKYPFTTKPNQKGNHATSASLSSGHSLAPSLNATLCSFRQTLPFPHFRSPAQSFLRP